MDLQGILGSDGRDCLPEGVIISLVLFLCYALAESGKVAFWQTILTDCRSRGDKELADRESAMGVVIGQTLECRVSRGCVRPGHRPWAVQTGSPVFWAL